MLGCPDGVMGNSEVGHENIGAGRIVDQELVRLNKLFSEKQLAPECGLARSGGAREVARFASSI